MNEEFITPYEASRMLKVTQRTLVNWDYQGKIKTFRTKGNHRRFLLSDVLELQGYHPEDTRKKICYCRVSTRKQKEDLNRQEEFFRHKFPDHDIIKDFGSGLNFKRKGLNSILDDAFKGNIQELVITHKDRLCRYGYHLIERIIQHRNGKIVVLNQENTFPEKELVNDLLSIITCFSSRLYGLRSHTIKKAIKESIQDNEVQTVSNSKTTTNDKNNV